MLRSRPALFSLFAPLALLPCTYAAPPPCADPAVPTGGFPIIENIDVATTWSDGYNVLMDVRYPNVAPTSCGWPMAVFVHGGGGNKGVVQGEARNFARAGYITCAYDVRGQGASSGLNPATLAHDLTGLRELLDLFEAMEAVEALYPSETDIVRIGVSGYSQGGNHSWNAAQHSGRVPPLNPWRTARFPIVSAVVVKDSGAVGKSTGVAFKDAQVSKLFSPSGTVYQPAALAAVQAFILAEDFDGLKTFLTVPGMDASTLLPLTTVPIYAHVSYDDKRVFASNVLASIQLVPATTPTRLQFGTSGHGSPNNKLDNAIYDTHRRLWFDRFLKGEMNGVDDGPEYFAHITPDDVADYLNNATIWDFRTHDAYPPAEVVTQRRYLGAMGNLPGNLPPAQTTSILTHTVPAGFDITAYTALLPNSNALQGIIPLDTIDYDSNPLPSDLHLHGEVVVQLSVDTLDADYQVHAVVIDVDASGDERYVTSGTTAVTATPGANVITVEPYVQSYVFRVGHRLRLRIQNLSLHSPPTGSLPEIHNVPYFTSSSVDIVQGGLNPSYVDFPTLPFGAPSLATYPLQQSVAAPENQRSSVHSHSTLAGSPYLLLPSVSGTSPSTLVAGALVPIQFDALTWAVVGNPSLPPFVNAAGILDVNGAANVGLQLSGLPLPASLVGIELSMAVIVGGTPNVATNAVTVLFVD